MWTGQIVIVGESQMEGRRSKPRSTRATIPHVSVLEETSEMGKTASLFFDRVLIDQDFKVVAFSVSVEVVRDMRYMITGFLEGDSMETSTGCRKGLRGVLARWAWVPLEHRAVLVMHEIADRVDEEACWLGLGSARRDMGSTMGASLGKDSLLVRSALWMEACVPAWAVLASCICVLIGA